MAGIFSIVGGKWTTFRLMAEEAVNEIAHRLGNTKPCRTADEVLPPPNFEHRSYPAPGGPRAIAPTTTGWASIWPLLRRSTPMAT